MFCTPQVQVPDDEGAQTKKTSKENEREQTGDIVNQTQTDFIVGEKRTVVSGKVYNIVVALLDCHKPTLIHCHKFYLRKGYGNARNIFSIA